MGPPLHRRKRGVALAVPFHSGYLVVDQSPSSKLVVDSGAEEDVVTLTMLVTNVEG